MTYVFFLLLHLYFHSLWYGNRISCTNGPSGRTVTWAVLSDKGGVLKSVSGSVSTKNTVVKAFESKCND